MDVCFCQHTYLNPFTNHTQSNILLKDRYDSIFKTKELGAELPFQQEKNTLQWDEKKVLGESVVIHDS